MFAQEKQYLQSLSLCPKKDIELHWESINDGGIPRVHVRESNQEHRLIEYLKAQVQGNSLFHNDAQRICLHIDAHMLIFNFDIHTQADLHRHLGHTFSTPFDANYILDAFEENFDDHTVTFAFSISQRSQRNKFFIVDEFSKIVNGVFEEEIEKEERRSALVEFREGKNEKRGPNRGKRKAGNKSGEGRWT